MSKMKEITIAVRMPIYLKQILEELSRAEGVSMSAYIRGLIQFEYQLTFTSSKKFPKGKSWIEDKLFNQK